MKPNPKSQRLDLKDKKKSMIIIFFSKKRRKNTTGLLPRKHVKEVQHPCKPALSKNISHCTIITKKSCPIATKKKKTEIMS
jgi:hypothetical protein